MTEQNIGDLLKSIEQPETIAEPTGNDDRSTQILDEFCADIEEAEAVDEAVVDVIDQLLSDESLNDSDRIVTEIISAVE